MKHLFAIILILALGLPSARPANAAPVCADKRGCQCYVSNRWVSWPCGKAAERACQLWSNRR
jgi:hypothetical protein